MNIIKIIFFSSSLLFSCKQKVDSEIDKSNTINSVKNLSESVQFDSINVSSIPFGEKMLIERFTKIGSNFEVSEEENNLLETENSKFLSFYERIFKNNIKPVEGLYKYTNKSIIDFGQNYIQPTDSISTYQGFYAISSRLPNVNNFKVFICNSIKTKNENYNIINNVDLIILNSKNQIINTLNLAHSIRIYDEKYSNEFDDYDKYFYIDKDYTIHIKYFTGWGDTVRRVFAYTKYKILQDGSIVQYFDEAEINYKCEVEEGEVKNHLKEGVWKESLSNFQTNYCIKKYHQGKVIDNIEIVITNDDGIKESFFIDKNTYLPVKK